MGRKRFITLLLLLSVLHSCALPAKQNVSSITSNNYESLFQATIEAVHDIDFLVVTSDINSGMIVAEKHFTDNGAVTHRLHIEISSISQGIKVGFIFDDDSVSIEYDKNAYKVFKEALIKRAPFHLNVMYMMRK